MRVLLVRHASAGERSEWRDDDRLRPLDPTGHRQAEALAPVLAELGATRLLSSPYARCIETLQPAAALLGLPVEERDELTEGASASEVTMLLAELDGTVPALSTHGDVIAALVGPERKNTKGSVWVLDVRDGDVRPKRYLPPPA